MFQASIFRELWEALDSFKRASGIASPDSHSKTIFYFAMTRSFLSISLCALIFPIIAGCSNNSSPGGGTSSVVIPTIGSTFVIARLDDGSSDTSLDRMTVVQTPSNTAGMRAVFDSSYANGFEDTAYYLIYASNGDVSENQTSWAGDPSLFERLPFGSHSAVDTSSSFSGTTTQTQAIWNGSGVPYSVNGNSFSTDSVTVVITTSSPGTATTTSYYTYSYIPALGIIARERDIPVAGATGYTVWLKSYTGK